ncbi:hypothetical protein ACW4TU_26560 [Streptomyces sp. QTS52]
MGSHAHTRRKKTVMAVTAATAALCAHLQNTYRTPICSSRT